MFSLSYRSLSYKGKDILFREVFGSRGGGGIYLFSIWQLALFDFVFVVRVMSVGPRLKPNLSSARYWQIRICGSWHWNINISARSDPRLARRFTGRDWASLVRERNMDAPVLGSSREEQCYSQGWAAKGMSDEKHSCSLTGTKSEEMIPPHPWCS